MGMSKHISRFNILSSTQTHLISADKPALRNQLSPNKS